MAVTANANRLGFYGCQFKSYQDTLYAKSGYQYYSNCYVEGAVDYIFGDATAWFGECELLPAILSGQILIWRLRYNRFKWGRIRDGQFSRDYHRLGDVCV